MPRGERKIPWLNPNDRLILLIGFAALAGVLGLHYALRTGLGRPGPEFTPGLRLETHRVDINRAEWWELQALSRIGEIRAKDIVNYRRANGTFKTVDDLMNVRGIGPKTVDRLRPYLTASGREETDEKPR